MSDLDIRPGPAAAAAPDQGRRFGLWVLRGLLAGPWLASGASMLFGAETTTRIFESYPFSTESRLVMGVAVVASSILLLVPRTSDRAAVALFTLGVFATGSHFALGDLFGTVVFCIPLVFIAAYLARRGRR